MSSGKSDEIQAKKYFQGEIGNSPLVNKLGITNQEELDKVEAYNVEHTMRKGLSDEASKLSPDGLKQMHKELFDKIYDWAGEYRNYTTGRGLPFCRPEYIESNLQKIYKDLNKEIYHGMPSDEFIKSSAKFIGELNVIHPFIDGNGRTQRATLDLIAEKSGFDINLDLLNKSDWYKSAEDCHLYATYDGFEKIISSVIQTRQNLEIPLSDEQKQSIEKYKEIASEQYKDQPEKLKHIFDTIQERLPDIASGKIILPDLPEKDKGHSR